MFAYPGLTDAEAAGAELFKWATGTTTPIGNLANDAWTCLGYGLSFVPTAATKACCPDDDDCCDEDKCKAKIKELLEPHFETDGKRKAAGVIPWAALIAVLVKLLPIILPFIPIQPTPNPAS